MKRMEVIIIDDIYRKLQEKCDKVGIGFPATKEGFELNYLQELFTPEEAEFFVKMKDGSQTAEEVADSFGEDLKQIQEILDSMSKKGLLFRVHEGTEVKYRTIPVIHGFYEFSMDRLTPAISKNFSKHYVRGMGKNFFGGEDPFFRVIPINTDIISNKVVLPIDNAAGIIERQEKIAVADCFCRTAGKMGPGGGCDNPLETCILFDTFADYYVENGTGRYITKEEALAIIKRSDELGLVIEVSNSDVVEVMCSCCSCCCGVLTAARLFPGPATKVMSNYICVKDEELCINCGICVQRCVMNAHVMAEDKVKYNNDLCIGCGLCVTTCPTKALVMEMKKEDKIYTPPAHTLMETYDYITQKRKNEGK